MLIFIINLAVAYLLGSIATAIIVSRCFGNADPRTQGSGNAGATNMLRTAGKKAGILTLLGDALKGVIAVLLGHLCHIDATGLAWIALFAVIGHIFPLWFQFKGGKGVATALGGLLALCGELGLMVLAILVIILFTTRYMSLASIIALITAPLLAIFWLPHAALIPLTLLSLLVIAKHYTNIQRLMAGTERKIKLTSQ